jgi:PAS domain S-box-containing protein
VPEEKAFAARPDSPVFYDAFRASPIGIALEDLEGRPLFVNPALCSMLGFSEEEMRSKHCVEVSPPEDAEKDWALFEQLRAGLIDHYSLDKRFFRRDGSLIWGRLSISLLNNGTPPLVVAIVEDITEQRRAEEERFRQAAIRQRAEMALRESEKRFRLVANTAPVMIWMSGPDKLCTYFNERWLEFTGRSLQQELGNGWAEGVHPDDLKRCWETYSKAFDRRESFEMHYRLRRHDGEHRWILDRGVPRFNADGSFTGYVGSCIDDTERKLAEEAFSTMSQRLIEAQEEERARIARELHDDISQRLAFLATNLDRLKHEIPPSVAAFGQEIGEVRKEVVHLATDVQSLSHRLHSSSLQHLGLLAAATSFCKELSERQNVQIDFHSEDIPEELSQEISLCLFRVLQEALQNAIKHSGSRHFQVSLTGRLSEMQLVVRDWGIGFDPQEALRGRGLGLTSMKERLKLVDGQLSIDSKPQQGTTIQARVPVRPRVKSAEAVG